ncbi:bifunctional phosphoribosylaminoimidazolecarboxamide formyltransferase/IMP cyclohydrolase, partial [Escherichia coli]
TDEARAIIADKKNLRLLVTGSLPDPKSPGVLFKTVAGGFLVQSRDAGHVEVSDLKVVTRRSPTAEELADLQFAFAVA